ncbi:MAG TPA: hypothetical protein PK024_11570 [Methanospirillum sp.]|nr:hypothetical protein [Methanospirillum sp.]
MPCREKMNTNEKKYVLVRMGGPHAGTPVHAGDLLKADIQNVPVRAVARKTGKDIIQNSGAHT